jgi:hypothetical protein
MSTTLEAVPQTTAIAPGAYEGMSFDEYAAAPGMNGSKIVYMRRSPMYYRWMATHPSPETDALKLGKIVHRMVLEPTLVDDVAVWGRLPEQKVRRGHHWDEFCQRNQDRVILTKDEAEYTTGAARAALSNAPIRKYANAEGPTEVSLFWDDPRTGLRFKARLDKIIPETHTIPDLKTTRDATPRRFQSQAYDLGYFVKMAHYWDGYRTLIGREPSLKLLALEARPPYESAVFDIPRDVVLMALDERNDLVDRIEECEKRSEWPAAQQDEVTLEYPTWAMFAMGDDDLALEA